MAEVLLGLTGPFSHGRGFTAPVSVATPATGADISYTVTGSYWLRLAALSYLFTTGSNAANRVPILEVLDETGAVLAAIPPAAAQTATLATTYTFLPNVSVVGAVLNHVAVAPLPNFFLRPGYKIVTATGAIDAADTYTKIRVVAEQIDTGPEGYPIGVVTVPDFVEAFERQG